MTASAWSEGAARKLSQLTATRLVTQALSVAWFIFVARRFDSDELGVLAAGLVTLSVVAVIADLGANWSIAREVTTDPRQSWPLFTQGVRMRTVATFAIGVPLLAVAQALVDGPVLVAIALGVAISAVGGVSDLALTALRSSGSVRLETLALPAERLAFIGIAGTAVLQGRGPHVVLGVYLLTNVVTAAGGSFWLARRFRGVQPPRRISLWTAETRSAGVASVLIALGPRVSAMLLVLLGTSVAVADFAVASRPVEQVAYAAIGFCTTLLPLVRDDEVVGRDAARRVGRLGLTLVAVILPGVAFVILAPSVPLDLMYGPDRYPDAVPVLAIVAVVVVTWPLRGMVAVLMVAREQARVLARVSVAGSVLNVAAGVPLILAFGAVGAAAALVLAEIATLAAVMWTSPLRVGGAFARSIVPLGVAGAGVGAAATVLPPIAGVILVAVVVVALAYGALEVNRRLPAEERSWA